MKIGRTLLLTASLAAVLPGFAQSPAFEAVSIRLNPSGNRFVAITPPGGSRFNATNINLRILVAIAYNVRSFQLSGFPAWADSERYDIIARADGNPSPAERASMLQAMLADRFQLRIHREMKELQGYALSVAKGGPRLANAKESNCGSNSPAKPSVPCGGFLILANRLAGTRVDMSQLASTLAETRDLGRPVVDNTSLAGVFDVQLEWTPSSPAGDSPQLAPLPDDSISIFSALREQLGLRLDSRKVPAEILVIDRAEKPSEN